MDDAENLCDRSQQNKWILTIYCIIFPTIEYLETIELGSNKFNIWRIEHIVIADRDMNFLDDIPREMKESKGLE